PRNPSLWQCLHAKKKYELENTQKFVDLTKQIAMQRGKTDSESQLHRKRLYTKKRKMFNEALRDWQQRQPVQRDDPPGYHRAIFDRVRFMMPERDRLAQNLIEVDEL